MTVLLTKSPTGADALSPGYDWSGMASLTYELYLDDDRYAVPTLHLLAAADEAGALRLAQRLLADSPHHLGVEICLEGERLAGLGSFAVRRAAPESVRSAS